MQLLRNEVQNRLSRRSRKRYSFNSDCYRALTLETPYEHVKYTSLEQRSPYQPFYPSAAPRERAITMETLRNVLL